MKRWSFAPRRIFVAGLLVTLPGVVAAYVVYVAFSYFDGLLEPLLRRYVHRDVPGLGLVLLVAFVFLVGLLTSNLFGARLVSLVSGWLEKIPLFSPLYRGLREISQMFLGEQAKAFRRVALVEWPRPGQYAMVFVMAESSAIMEASVGRPLTTVFLPTTPNPTTGFVLYVPTEDVIAVDLSIEQAIKICISIGAVLAGPGPVATPRTAAAARSGAAPLPTAR